MSTSRVRELVGVILKRPQYLEVDYSTRISEIAYKFQTSPLPLPTWNWPGFYPQSDDFEERCLFYLIFNSINYCYFDQNGSKFRDGDFGGATLACKSLTDSWHEIKDPLFLSNVDENYLLTYLFKADTPISLVKERTAALREVGSFLNKNDDFTFKKLFLKYRSDAYLVSQALPLYLPTWRDPFFKRAQLFVGMIYGAFQDRQDLPIKKDSLANLTVFSDYRVPQSLLNLGIIRALPFLSEAILNGDLIPSGSAVELELRAAAIRAADLLLADLQKYREEEGLTILHVDYLLWALTQSAFKLPKGVIQCFYPPHRTITTDY